MHLSVNIPFPVEPEFGVFPRRAPRRLKRCREAKMIVETLDTLDQWRETQQNKAQNKAFLNVSYLVTAASSVNRQTGWTERIPTAPLVQVKAI